jgi:proteic killer suppression protein
MIKSFACRDTEKVWNGLRVRIFPDDMQDRALRKLRQLDAAQTLNDLINPPGNRLEILKGNRKGQRSIRVNDQWRVCFIWRDNEAYEVEITDYH